MFCEFYVDIKGYEGLYQVSNLGNVKSLNYNKTGKAEILNPGVSRGYLRVGLIKEGKRKQFGVHRLVAIAFLPNPNNYTDVHHINRYTSDNRVENLKWLNRAEHEQEHSELNADDIVEIFRLYNVEGWTQQRIADKYAKDQTLISYILRRRSWSNVPIPAEYL